MASLGPVASPPLVGSFRRVSLGARFFFGYEHLFVAGRESTPNFVDLLSTQRLRMTCASPQF
jgi:hypothetical protein